MSAHTEGPWRVLPDVGDLHSIWADRYLLLARTCFRPSSAANARLIAAAPELLDALVKLTNEAAGFLAMSEVETHGHTNRAVLRERIRLAQDAIAKAEGKR